MGNHLRIGVEVTRGLLEGSPFSFKKRFHLIILGLFARQGLFQKSHQVQRPICPFLRITIKYIKLESRSKKKNKARPITFHENV